MTLVHPLTRIGAACLVAAAASVAAAEIALAQAPPAPPGTSCVEVIPAQAGIQPAILLDKCSGRTWQLVPTYPRRRGAGYVWRPLPREDVQVAPAARVAQPPAAASAKCFSFNGRTFCE